VNVGQKPHCSLSMLITVP